MAKKYNLYIMSDDNAEIFELDIDTFNTSTIFSIENLQDITKRNDTITYDIKLLRTKSNNIALGNLFDISTFSSTQYTQQLGHNFTPNQFVNCQLFEDNTQLLKGKLQIVDFNDTEYNAVITGEVVSFMGNIKDRFLHELDSLSQTTLYNYTYITPTWTSTTSPYIFPMLDYGVDYRTGNFDPYDNNFEFNNFRPAFYLKSYLNAIFKGFRFDDTKQVYTQKKEDNTLLNNNTVDLSKIESIINKIFIPNNFENFTRSEEGIITKILMSTPAQSGNNLNLQTINGVASEFNSSVDDFWTVGTKTNFKLWESSGGGGVTQLSMPTLKPNDKYINCTLNMRFRLVMPVGTVGTWMVGLADVAGANKLEQGQLKHYTKVQKTDITSSQEFSMEFDLQVDNLQGEFAFVFFREDQSAKDSKNETGIEFDNIAIQVGKENTTTEISVNYNDTIDVFNYIPKDIKIVDFLKSIMQMFNLYLYQDKDIPNRFVFETYNDFYKNIITLNPSNSVDWSDKIEWNKAKFSTNINLPKSYSFKFVEDSDMMNDYYSSTYKSNYGDYMVLNENGTEDDNAVELIFAPTQNLSHSKDLKNLPIIYESDSLMGEKKPFKSELRILYNNGLKSLSTSYEIKNGDTLIGYRPSYNYCSMLSFNTLDAFEGMLLFDVPFNLMTYDYTNINKSKSLFNLYYTNRIKELTDNNLTILEVEIFLTKEDIEELDFTKPIYVENEDGNAYFKLLEVNYNNNTLLSKCKLQKITI
ncbi:hypothetical protein [Sphingobacterium sp.]|uniref:hypothetical protein n=1 Tax=Sphingobacterium sp. TaxID=341027 RepID=UPI0028AD6441|nr:hypothetical protein [Sphingobacterium sp.]